MLDKRFLFILFLLIIAIGSISLASAADLTNASCDDMGIDENMEKENIDISNDEAELQDGPSTVDEVDIVGKSNEDAVGADITTGSDEHPASLINSSPSDVDKIPSSYDSRDYGYITPVKDQGNSSTNWAFAGIATLEACIKKITNITYDFSESGAKDVMDRYYIMDLDFGGYDTILMDYLTGWLGPVDEKSLGYPNFHIQNIKFLPERKNSSDNDAIKRAIMDYGAVSIIFLWSDGSLHAVSLVGWDDNFNGEDCLGNHAKGAWIFKNSWGTDWGDNGFGHLAYDVSISGEIADYCHAYTFIFNRNDSYQHNYLHEFVGLTDYLVSDSPVSYKNVFTAKEEELLCAFSTYFKAPTAYNVTVQINDVDALSQSGYSEAGYYTIPLNKRIHLNAGDSYAVVIQIDQGGENYVPVCQSVMLNETDLEPGKSLVSFDGGVWLDLYNLTGDYDFLYYGIQHNTSQVACINAFTTNDYKTVTLNVTEFTGVYVNERMAIDMTLSGGNFDLNGSLITLNIDGKDYYAAVNDGKAHLDIAFDKAGIHTLSAQYKNNLFESNIVKFNFTSDRKGALINADNVNKIYGGNENALISLKDNNGNAIAGAEISFAVNGNVIKIRTDSKGQASVPVNMAPKSYVATISFLGNDVYGVASKEIRIVVKKATPKMTASKKTFKIKAKSKKYSIVLKDSSGRAIKGAKVTLKIKAKTYRATTNAKGKATFKVKFAKKGKFTSTVKFAGNSYYNAVTKKVKITFKK